MNGPRPTGATRALSPSSRVFLLAAMVVLVTVNASGAGYYALPMAERVRSVSHVWLRPSGYVGQSAGILATLIFAFLWLYPVRKKFRSLAWTGPLSRWLDVHITAALTLPLLLTVHGAWHFGGIPGLSFDAMMIVCASGIVGRYLYVRIPRSASGIELTLDEIAAQRRTLVTDLAATTGLDPAALEQTLSAAVPGDESPGIARAFVAMLSADVARWRVARELRRAWRHLPSRAKLNDRALTDAIALAEREIALEQQVRFLRATHRIFRFWHVAHKPIAVTALVAAAIHIGVVVALGATWLW